MAKLESGQVNSVAASGPGWKRLDDGNYLWQRHKWTEAKIISEETFKAVRNVRLFETIFAILTLSPVAPMMVALLKGHLLMTTFATILACLVVPNILVNLYVMRRVRYLTQDAKPFQQPFPVLSFNPLRTISDRHLRGAIILLLFWALAILFGLVQLIPGTGLPPPPKQLNVYLAVCMLAIVAVLLYAAVQERARRRRQG